MVAPPLDGVQFPPSPAPGELVGCRPGPRTVQHQEDLHQGRASPRGQAKALASPGWAEGAQGTSAGVPVGSGANGHLGGGKDFHNGKRARASEELPQDEADKRVKIVHNFKGGMAKLFGTRDRPTQEEQDRSINRNVAGKRPGPADQAAARKKGY
eukprot:5341095-Heterocapsa_arctica.AAC.1